MFSASLRCVPSFVFASHYLRAVTIFVSFLGIFLTGLSTSSLDLMQSIFLSFPLMELSKMQTTHYSPLTKPSVHSLLPLNLGPKSLACPGYHIGPVSPFLSGPYPSHRTTGLTTGQLPSQSCMFVTAAPPVRMCCSLLVFLAMPMSHSLPVSAGSSPSPVHF